MSSSSPTLCDFGLGRLAVQKSQETVPYQPVEISQYGIGVVAPHGLKNGTVLTLDREGAQIYLEVAESHPYREGGELTRYTLKTMDPDADLEAIFATHAVKPNIRALELFEPIRFARFSTEPQIVVHAKTFGTVGFYQLSSVNVSRSGMLVMAQRERMIPFHENTLLEMTIVPRGDWLFQPVHVLAKVIRVDAVGNETTGESRHFGIKFIEFQDQGQIVWDRTVRSVEQTVSGRRVFLDDVSVL